MARPKPKLTKEDLTESLKAPNNCQVRQFLDGMDEESRLILEEALAMTRTELPAAQVISLLLNAGYDEDAIPGYDAILDHRARRRPCRCQS